MYTRHDVLIDQPVESVRRELLEPPDRWLPPSVASPLGDGRHLVRVGFHAGGMRVAKQVELTLGAPEQPGQWLVIPVTWRATGPEGLFPVLDGRLTVQPLGPHSSTIWMGATYQPPLAAVGREVNALIMHNVAAATVREFVEGVAARLTELAAVRPA
jgi:hypothetical protein